MFLVFILLLLLPVVTSGNVQCNAAGTCACELSNGDGKIDVSILARITPIPTFTAKFGTIEVRFDPCRQFGCGSSSSTNVCANDEATGVISPIGDELKFDYDENSKHVSFIYAESQSILTYVKMICSTDDGVGELSIQELGSDHHNFLQLQSKFACLMKSDHNNKLSIGSILCIVFLVFVFLYIVLGCIVNKYIRKNTSGEHFPNIEFWRDLPSLIQGGCVFSYQCVKGLRKKNDDYTNI